MEDFAETPRAPGTTGVFFGSHLSQTDPALCAMIGTPWLAAQEKRSSSALSTQMRTPPTASTSSLNPPKSTST